MEEDVDISDGGECASVRLGKEEKGVGTKEMWVSVQLFTILDQCCFTGVLLVTEQAETVVQ